MDDIDELVSEALGSFSQTYSTKGVSEAPRKDFVPVNKTGNYAFPYQRGGEAIPPLPNDQDRDKVQASTAYPIDLSIPDFADSFAYLEAGLTKIRVAIDNNPVLQKDQVKKLKKLIKHGEHAQKIISLIGTHVGDVATLIRDDKTDEDES